MKAFQGHEEIRYDELMGMRWVVTVKQFPEKVKARLVMMGYQAGVMEDEFAGSGIAFSNSQCKHCFLQVAAHFGFELKKVDVYGAFLQG